MLLVLFKIFISLVMILDFVLIMFFLMFRYEDEEYIDAFFTKFKRWAKNKKVPDKNRSDPQ